MAGAYTGIFTSSAEDVDGVCNFSGLCVTFLPENEPIRSYNIYFLARHLERHDLPPVTVKYTQVGRY